MGEQKIEEKEAVKKKYSVPSYERRDTFAIWTEQRTTTRMMKKTNQSDLSNQQLKCIKVKISLAVFKK